MPKPMSLRGNSGSGKTTAAEALQKKFGRNTMVISQDVVRRDMLWVRDGTGTAALPLLILLLQYGKQNSEVTILENIWNSECSESNNNTDYQQKRSRENPQSR